MNSPEDHCPSPLRSVLLLHDDIHSWSLVVCHSRSVACHACRRQASKVAISSRGMRDSLCCTSCRQAMAYSFTRSVCTTWRL